MKFAKSAELVLRFLFDILVGLIGAVLIGGAALLIGLFVKWLDSFQVVPSGIIKSMTLVEQGLFVVDAICFSFLVVMSGFKLCVEIWKEYR